MALGAAAGAAVLYANLLLCWLTVLDGRVDVAGALWTLDAAVYAPLGTLALVQAGGVVYVHDAHLASHW
jgi:hypothetical protein